MLEPDDFFDLTERNLHKLLSPFRNVWEILAGLPRLVAEMVGTEQRIEGSVSPGATLSDRPIYVGPGAVVEPGAYILGPAYIGANVVIRHGAYVRSNCVFLDSSLLGHASEAKNALFLPHAKAPHFAYVGDSILGHGVNLGAGTKLSNLPIEIAPERQNITIAVGGHKYDTGLTKLGAILGDGVETGCNVVTNPGVLILPRTMIYPGVIVNKGLHAGKSIIKLRQVTEHVSIV